MGFKGFLQNKTYVLSDFLARRPRPNGGRPSRNCTSDDDCGRRVCNIDTSTCVRCNGDDDCTRGNRNTCDNNRCVASCTSDDECRGRKPVCNTDTSRCVRCNVDADCTNGNRNTCENNRCIRQSSIRKERITQLGTIRY